MPYEFKMTHLVEFVDTDMANIVHFANYFRYMEATEHAFLRSLGLSVHMKDGDRILSWPRVHAECDYKAPLRFEDEVEVHLLVREKKAKSLTYDFLFHKVEEEPRTLVARGSITTVFVIVDPQTRKMKAATMPEDIARRFEVAPPE